MGGRLLATGRRPGPHAPGSASSDLRKVGELCGELRTWIIGAASDRRPFHDNESGVLQMPHDPITGDFGRESVAIVHPFPPAEYEGKRDGFDEIVRINAFTSTFRALGTVAVRPLRLRPSWRGHRGPPSWSDPTRPRRRRRPADGALYAPLRTAESIGEQLTYSSQRVLQVDGPPRKVLIFTFPGAPKAA
jgi:hypothetical protein